MYIDRNRKPGLVKRIDNIGFWVIILTGIVLFILLKLNPMRENYKGLHDDHGKLKERVVVIEEKIK